jgi:putative Ca2+/H+ antiporter (TMEM165/GDT1 family)
MFLISIIAIFTGKYLSRKISEKSINFVSGIIFMIYGVNVFLKNIKVA